MHHHIDETGGPDFRRDHQAGGIGRQCGDLVIEGSVSVDAGVTHDGVHGYHVARTEGDVAAGYKKD